MKLEPRGKNKRMRCYDALFLASLCSSHSGLSNDILFVWVESTKGVDLGSWTGIRAPPLQVKTLVEGHVAYRSIRQVFLNPVVAFATR